MTELKPCPFCGCEAELKTNKKYRKGYIAAVGCKSQLCPAYIQQASTRTVEKAYEHAANMWNRRV